MSVNSEISGRNRPKRRFNIHDLEAIAELAAKRFTDKMACEVLDFKYDSFRNYLSKARNQARFNDILTRVRGNQLKAHIENIEDGANGVGVHKRADWRASETLIKLKFPELLPQTTSEPPQVTVQIGIMHEQLKRVIGFSNDSDNRSTIDSEKLLLSDSVHPADNDIQELKSNPTKICMPIRQINK